ncbi:MAG: hypothetical protein H8E66_19010 [Planctomycetes bacterium]|nr:hypothetical protein [Planctomycetota bacterium]
MPTLSRLSFVTYLCFVMHFAEQSQAAETITYVGYPNCIELRNETTRVVLCAEAGGRVLVYALAGENALYLEEEDRGKDYVPGERASMSAGRFDIGPEKIIPRRDLLWSGKWQGEITAERSAKLTSQKDSVTGTQLVRDFRLAKEGSHLSCTQTIFNISDGVTEWCHWSRTFARGNGICVIPLTTNSRFPNNYVMYETGNLINLRPTDPNIRTRNGFLEITGVPKEPKLGMDSYAGWFGYLMPHDVMFVKRYKVYPERVYNEVAGLTISIWYPEEKRVELEPIGPRERLNPGESASFTEDWWLLPYEFPTPGQSADLRKLNELVQKSTTLKQRAK